MRAFHLLLLFFTFIYGYSNAPVTILGNASGCPGSTVTNSLTVNGFNNISSISLRIDYNPSCISLDTAININPQLTNLLINNVNISSCLSKILITWSDIYPVTLANGSKILDLVFIVISGSSALAFNNQSNNGADCEYADVFGDALIDTPTASYYTNGLISEPVAVGGNVSGSKMIVIGQNTGNLELTGNEGDVLTWQKKYNDDDYEAITDTSGLLTYSEVPVYTGTWHYRALVTYDGCSQDYSSPAVITVVIPTGTPRTWTGMISDDWIHPGNWNPGGVPTNTDDLIIPAGTPNMPKVKNDGLICTSLEISTGAMLTIITGSSLNVLKLPWSCGNSLIINHTTGAVAPVDKTVIYGTVTNIPGEASKCWISSNLGSDHQATAVNDATEASAGWYWQFNRMQGYKHDGGTRTPNTAWVSGISENSNWIGSNDPCTILLGSQWRIPTLTEWTNVYAAGGWTDWNGVWNSALKLHAGGYLEYYNGALSGRGLGTDYWSSAQNDNSSGFHLLFNSALCFIHIDHKAYGFTTRCLKDCGPSSSPTTGTHTSTQTQIIWNWNTVSEATGYKWNTTDDYVTATDLGTCTTKTETGLNCGTSYSRYVWAYNCCGPSSAITLTQSTSACPWICGQSITDSRDSKIYNTVLIGTQCWMAQNLNFGTRINGSGNQLNNGIYEKYCYADNEANCNVYGGLYQWDEFINYQTSSNSNPSGRQGICPEGWHIPSDSEWCQMEIFLDATVNCTGMEWRGTDVGGKMKEPGTSHWASPNVGATNSSGLTVLPSGYRGQYGGFDNLSITDHFWSASEGSYSLPWYRALGNYSAQAYRFDNNAKTYGFSARCIKD